MVTAGDVVVGRVRDIGKAQTRRALFEAALTLFAENGYDNTTAEAIAASVGVSTRTFFRHFATKESVIFFGEDYLYQSFLKHLLRQPSELPALEAICAAFVEVAPNLERLRERNRQYRKAISTSSALRGQEQQHLRLHADAIAAVVGSRRGASRPDAVCTMIAAVSVTVLEMAIADWAVSPTDVNLADLVAERFGMLGRLTDARVEP
jgi:AcrR family transcriptional regulator